MVTYTYITPFYIYSVYIVYITFLIFLQNHILIVVFTLTLNPVALGDRREFGGDLSLPLTLKKPLQRYWKKELKNLTFMFLLSS